MVEGDGVRRTANDQNKSIKGQRFKAVSPNGKFAEGAAAIDGKILYRVEAIGKNLFHFYSSDAEGTGEVVVVRIHFGMAGSFRYYYPKTTDEIPGP